DTNNLRLIDEDSRRSLRIMRLGALADGLSFDEYNVLSTRAADEVLEMHQDFNAVLQEITGDTLHD
ncbi:MAG TPA: hypothetical protein VK983_00685, partial [Candidatus Limnocylindrales bacterium]|nr:hypothetical protein [Candidatus Limnocylindrales bacterium]